MTDRVTNNIFDLAVIIAQIGQRFGDNTVDNLEIAAARQFLELDDSKIRLNAGGVTIHDQTNGAGWRNHGCLGITVTMGFTKLKGVIPCFCCGFYQ